MRVVGQPDLAQSPDLSNARSGAGAKCVGAGVSGRAGAWLVSEER